MREDERRKRAIARRKRQRRRRMIRRMIFLTFFLLLIIAGGGFFLFTYTAINDYVIAEAGTELNVNDFAKRGQKAKLLDGNVYDMSVPGEYDLKVRVGLFSHNVILKVVDTVAPVVHVREASVTVGEEINPDLFIESYEDATEIKASLETKIDTSEKGKYDVMLSFTDLGGNTVTEESVLYVSPYVAEYELEAGSPLPSPADLAVCSQNGVITTGEGDIILNHVGDFVLNIAESGLEYPIVVHVVDTTAPVIKVKDIEAYFTSELKGTEFIAECYDATDITARFETEPDMSSKDSQEVTITFTDEGGNSVTESAHLTLKKDKEAPVIACQEHVQMNLGDSVLYRELVSVTDNDFNNVTLDIDKDTVNVNEEGSYTVTFTATDRAGNQTSREMVIEVIKPAYSQEEVDALADEVLAKIINDTMSDKEKAEAIYRWVQGNVGYISHSEKDDWLKAAYEGLHDHQGDCFVFAKVSKELLTRAGIRNMDIDKIPAQTMHYWNLVDYGEGWYHFDTTPRRNAHNFCLVTDAELMEYSKSNNNSHNYDPDDYPEIN